MDGNRPGAIGIGVGAALAPDRRLGLAVNTGRVRELQDRRPRSGCILGLSVLLTALMTCSRLYFFPEPVRVTSTARKWESKKYNLERFYLSGG